MRKHKRLMTLAMAVLSIQFLASCFSYKKEETVSPEPTVVTVPAPTTTTETTTHRSTTQNY
jgi:hypothetical protein